MTSRFAALLLLGALLACGPPTLDQAVDGLQARLDAREFEQLVQEAPAVLARCVSEKAGMPTLWRVEKLRLQALAKQGQGEQGLAELTRLAAAHPDKVDAQLYFQVVADLSGAGDLVGAIRVVDAGLKRFPDKREYFEPQLAALKKKAENDGAANDTLKQLGYL